MLPLTPIVRARIEGQTGITPKAKRPPGRPASGVPNGAPLSHEDLTAAFYAINVQLQAEQQFTNDLYTCVAAHAEDLDGAGRRVSVLKNEVKELQDQAMQLHGSWTSDVQNLYTRITSERDESMNHQRGSTQVELRQAYEQATKERQEHVVQK